MIEVSSQIILFLISDILPPWLYLRSMPAGRTEQIRDQIALKDSTKQPGCQIFYSSYDIRTVCLVFVFIVLPGGCSYFFISIVFDDCAEIRIEHIDIEFLLH